MPITLFEELGFTYIGPIDGHSIEDMCEVFGKAKNVKGPVLIHVITKKGKGYDFAEERTVNFALNCLVPIMLGLQMYDIKAYDRFVAGNDSSVMQKILLGNESWFDRGSLVGDDEEMIDNNQKIKGKDGAEITVEYRLEQLYHAIFLGEGQDRYGRITIGAFMMNRNVQSLVEEATSLLSGFSDFDFK